MPAATTFGIPSSFVPRTMPHQEDELSIISQQQYTDYTNAWIDFIKEATADELTGLLRPDASKYLPCVSLPCEPLIWLLSTMGMRQVKARFALLPAASGAQARFAVALFATDEHDTPASAYYLATGTWQPAPAPREVCKTQSPENAHVPLALGNAWLAGWEAATTIEPTMFDTTPAPARLQGYNFGVRDFVDPLFALESGITDQTLQVYFGLHTYYGATEGQAGPSRRQTLGLVLGLAGTDVHNATYFDMAQPSPPNP